MNQVHKSFAPFLDAIAPPKSAGSVRPISAPIGQMEYVYIKFPLMLICHLEYEEAEKGLGDSPDLTASATLISAYANGMDIAEVLDKDTIKLIEIKAAASLEE